jgi:hypothetical protein
MQLTPPKSVANALGDRLSVLGVGVKTMSVRLVHGSDESPSRSMTTALAGDRHRRMGIAGTAWCTDKQPRDYLRFPVDHAGHWFERSGNHTVISTRMRRGVAERYAALGKLDRALWHAYRRKWASERNHLWIVDDAASGGWKATSTLLEPQTNDDGNTPDGKTNGRPKAAVSRDGGI